MKKERFFRLLGDLDDQILDKYRQMDLQLSRKALRKKRTLRVLAVAACLVLLIGACVPVGMMIEQLGKGPFDPPPTISLQNLAELETMREMVDCEDEQELLDYLHGITGGGAESRQDLIDFLNLVDNTPYARFIDGEITGLTYNKTDECFSVSVEADDGESMYCNYQLGVSDVEKQMAKAARKLGRKNLLSAPLSTADGRLTLYTETREPSSNGDVIRWQGVLDSIAVYIVYWVADADMIDTATLLGSLEIADSIVPQFPKYAWANTEFGTFVENPKYERYCGTYESYSIPDPGVWVNKEGYVDLGAPATYRITDTILGDIGPLEYAGTWPQTLEGQAVHIYEIVEDGASYTVYMDAETGAWIGWEVGGKVQTPIATSEQEMMELVYAYLESHVSDPEAYTAQVFQEGGYTFCGYFRCVGDMLTCDAVTAKFDSEGVLDSIIWGYLGAFRHLEEIPNELIDTVRADLKELGQQYENVIGVKITRFLHIAPDGRVALECTILALGVEHQYLAYLTEPGSTNPDSGKVYGNGLRIWDAYHPDDSERNPYFSIPLVEFHNAVVECREDGKIYADDAHLIGGPGYNCSSFYLCDLTGDGYRELCFCMGYGSGVTDMRIVIIDFTTKETIFAKEDRYNHDYYLFLRDGALCVKETEYRENDAVRTGVLTYSGSEIYISWDSMVNATVDRDHVPAPGEPIN